jgi:hypothetical protein
MNLGNVQRRKVLKSGSNKDKKFWQNSLSNYDINRFTVFTAERGLIFRFVTIPIR